MHSAQSVQSPIRALAALILLLALAIVAVPVAAQTSISKPSCWRIRCGSGESSIGGPARHFGFQKA